MNAVNVSNMIERKKMNNLDAIIATVYHRRVVFFRQDWVNMEFA